MPVVRTSRSAILRFLPILLKGHSDDCCKRSNLVHCWAFQHGAFVAFTVLSNLSPFQATTIRMACVRKCLHCTLVLPSHYFHTAFISIEFLAKESRGILIASVHAYRLLLGVEWSAEKCRTWINFELIGKYSKQRICTESCSEFGINAMYLCKGGILIETGCI